jgi:hypothetical protein
VSARRRHPGVESLSAKANPGFASRAKPAGISWDQPQAKLQRCDSTARSQQPHRHSTNRNPLQGVTSPTNTEPRRSTGLPPTGCAEIRANNDPGGLDRLVATLNALYGAVVSTSLHSCPAQIETTTYRLAFHTEHGDVTYQWINGCDPEIELTRAGKPISPPGTRATSTTR